MSTERQDSRFEFRGFRLEPGARRVFRPDGEPLTLRSKEFDTLRFLVERAGEPVGKDELMAAVWPDSVVEENNLNQAISKLRQALDDNRHNPEFIATLPGRGYQFVASVQHRPASEEAAAVDAGQRGFRSASRLSIAVLVVGALGFAVWSLRPAEPEEPLNLDDPRLATPSPASYSMPTLSPDGTLMAFVSDRSGVDQIWVQGIPDGKPVQITHGEDASVSPSWSPIDDAILFQRAGPDGGRSIWITDALGSNPPRLVVRDGSWPRFSSDGRSFTFTRGITDIHVGFFDRDDAQRIEGIPETPGFAPAMAAMNAAGDIAFVLADEGPSGNLWVYTAATGEARQITQTATEFAGVWAEAPAWTPDGRSIIFAAADGELGNTHLWQADPTTGSTVRLTAGVGGYGHPAISRDGSRVLYSYARPVWRLVRTDPATGSTRILHESRDAIALPATSSDGQTVVYFYDNVYTQAIDGGEPVQITFGQPGEATLPAWSRSDERIFYYRNRNLHRLDPATGTDEQVVADFHWSSQHWLAAHGDRLAFRQRTPPESARSVILDIGSGEELVLDDPILPTDWSRDGTTLLGTLKGGLGLATCTAPNFTCAPILDGDEAVGGAMPRWSSDESRVFFRRARSDKPGYADIWAVDANGGKASRVIEIGPYEPASMFFAIASDDSIIWNEYDHRGRSEIWLVDEP